MNKVYLSGKISRVEKLRYALSGLPSIEFILGVSQQAFSKPSVGYFHVVVTGELAEQISLELKVGREVNLEGGLYQRSYIDRSGSRVDEVKIFAETFKGNLEDKK